MTSRDLQAEVICLLAHERGLSSEKIHLSDQLLHDLGMDGDDAVDFFNSLHERFGTDLSHLEEHWSEHFGSEGFSWQAGFVIVAAAAIGGVVTSVSDLSTVWGIAITIALLAAWLLVMRRWGSSDRMVPITIGEVVVAVEAGTWASRSTT